MQKILNKKTLKIEAQRTTNIIFNEFTNLLEETGGVGSYEYYFFIYFLSYLFLFLQVRIKTLINQSIVSNFSIYNINSMW